MPATLHNAHVPRGTMLGLVFISIFLLSFIMVGCMHPTGAFSSVYVLEYKYNPESPFYEYIDSSNSSTSSADTSVANVTVRIGLMGVCTTLGSEIKCTSMEINKLNTSQLHTIPDFVIYEGSSSTALGRINLLDLALDYDSKRAYGVMMGTLICLGIATVSIVFVFMFPTQVNDWRSYSGYIFLSLAFIFILVCDLILCTTSQTTQAQVQAGSFGLVAVSICRKTACMYWVAFVFIFGAVCSMWPTHIRQREEVFLEQKNAALRVDYREGRA